MQLISSDARYYDRKTIIFHWAIALLVTLQWVGAQTIDWFPEGSLRVDARSMHILLGLVLTALLVARIIWRLTKGRRLPRADTGLLGSIARGVHLCLYVLLLAMVVAGIVLAWTRGDNIFNLFNIPAYDPGNHSLANQVQEIHRLIGWWIVGLVSMHASVALFHRLILKDGVLDRMWPGKNS